VGPDGVDADVMLFLRLKLVVYVLAAAALASAASMKLALDGQHAAACARVVQVNESRAQALAKSLAAGVASDDVGGLKRVLQARLAGTEWRQVTVLDQWGEVLVSEPPSPRPEGHGAEGYMPGL